MRCAPAFLTLAAIAAATGSLEGQERPSITVRVRQIAGSTVYFDVGTRNGLATGDTIQVTREDGAAAGLMVVTATSDQRSVFTFAGGAFALTRGENLVLALLREPDELPGSSLLAGSRRGVNVPQAESVPAPPQPMQVRSAPPRPSVFGRYSFGMSSTRSTTRFGGADPVKVPRTFATPSVRLDITAPQAVGGFTLRVSSRLAYRHSSTASIQPPVSARVYSAYLEKRFTSIPGRITLGRFNSPVESYSGYWDGMSIRLGGSGLGVGALVGFEPDRWNERPSLELPKATVFVDASARRQGWRWSGDLSLHTVRPADSLATHDFLGATQRLTVGRLFLGHDIQLDRDPTGGGMRMSRLRLRSTLEVSDAVQLRATASRREGFLMTRPDDPFAAKSDRLNAGALFITGGGYVSLDGGSTRNSRGQTSSGVTASLSTNRILWFSGGGSLSASRWSGDAGNWITVAPSARFQVGERRVRVGYRLYHSDFLNRVTTTHGLEASLDTRLASGLRLSARSRIQWGRTLQSQSLDLTLTRVF